MLIHKKLILVPLVAILMSSCNWVNVSEGGESVRLLTQSQASNCNRIGTTTSTTTDNILIIQRGAESVQNALIDLARNEAALMGGNAIVAETTVQDGRQRFIVYTCP